MHLVEILALRFTPASALFLALTRRCPMSCAHCSTSSLLNSEEHPREIFLRLVETFTADNRPDLVLLTGGEALLRPKLVYELTQLAHSVGTRVYLISGMFFASQPEVPKLITSAIHNVDHFVASLDVFHEEQVSRKNVFGFIGGLLDRGQDVSFQIAGTDQNDPYLSEVVRDIRAHFQDRVPILVTQIGAVGRARNWYQWKHQRRPRNILPLPCGMASWPTVTFDGTVVACCNQTVVDGPVPPHLLLGHAATDDWAKLRERCLKSTMLRAIRVMGPEYIVKRYGSGTIECTGYCSTCFQLSEDPEIAARLEPVMARRTMQFIEEHATISQQEGFVHRYGISAYADLLELGYKQ